MRAPAAAIAILLAAGPVAAQELRALQDAVSMAQRSGTVIGAASACGAPGVRISAVRRKVYFLLRLAALDPADFRAARDAQSRRERQAAAAVRAGHVSCEETMRAFERAERG